MKSLNELRDELVKNVVKYEGTKKFDYYNEALAKLAGFDAAIKAQAEQSSSADVDECKFKVFWISADDNGLLDVYRYEPDNHGHQSLKVIDAAALSAMKGENEFLKTLIAQSNYRTENELEKLRAEKANEWKRMDEAKDAFFRVIDQLSAAVDQQAIEVNKLSELKGK